jgi:hypothetical protein
MKTKYPNLFGILAALMLVVSFVLPASMASPTSVAADPGICKWDTLSEPGAIFGTFVVGTYNGLCTEPIDIAMGNDSNTVAFIVTVPATYGSVWGPAPPAPYPGPRNILVTSTSKGVFCTLGVYSSLYRTPGFGGNGARNLFQVVMAPDNAQYMAVTSDNGTIGTGPREVWVTNNGGAQWQVTNLNTFLTANSPNPNETIRTIDVSVDYGGKRDIAVGTADGAGNGRLIVAQSIGFAGWVDQLASGATLLNDAVDFFALKFSPSYASDAALTAVFADATDTYYNVFLRDVSLNTSNSVTFSKPGVVIPPVSVSTASASYTELNRADLELPSDFSGQAASLRRAYVSLDTYNGGVAKAAWDGIVRLDNSTLYVLMDTSGDPTKSIYSIAYFGTYASGKLLAGDRIGYPCEAAVPTYFTDSPTTCPIPCWYDAAKPTTGAACQGSRVPGAKDGIGAAIVNWFLNGQLGTVITSSNASENGTTWWAALLADPTCYDESAYGISRNNGETWNQLSLIDSIINKMTDIAPTPDCKTIYMTSVNTHDTQDAALCGFDSVWRTSQNPDVTSPLAPLPPGSYWERVFTHVTAPDCTIAQTNYALLRIVPYCADPTGEIVAWGVYNGPQTPTDTVNHSFPSQHGVAYWSPDFGDYWASVTVRNSIQDFCFESRTVLYFLSPDGLVQKMPYTGTAWSSAIPNVLSYAAKAHTIAAYPEGKVLVGWGGATVTAASYSSNFNTDTPSMAPLTLGAGPTFGGNMHVAFDSNFNDTSIFYMAEESIGTGGSVYRNNPTAIKRWKDTDMMALTNGAIFCPAQDAAQAGNTGIFVAFTGQALYVASQTALAPTDTGATSGGVWRTIDDGTGKYGPLSGLPKPGIAWDRLYVGLVSGIVPGPAILPLKFTLQPQSLKGCGCCTLDTDTTLYAIDDNTYYGPTIGAGKIWGFTDCLAKRGPALITEDAALIGCDPVSGRAQEVNLCWEQLCVADGYDIEISKNADFTIKVVDWVSEADCGGFLVPTDVTSPCVYFPAGGLDFTFGSSIALFGNLECGHTYYWRVKARECATTQVVRSPWSEARSFTVKAGLPVVSPYLGLQLLSPNNGCLGCPVAPASFSWSPFKETTKYKFVLAKDSEMTQVVKEAEVSTTAYEYDGTLDYSTNYFWRVMSEEPAPSDWSATFSFQTEAQPAQAQGPAPAAPTPIWVWVVIAIGAILVIVTLVLIFKTRRV